ncbi:hypothetical protein C2G38_2107427, partial [Gigaspora rosea]
MMQLFSIILVTRLTVMFRICVICLIIISLNIYLFHNREDQIENVRTTINKPAI